MKKTLFLIPFLTLALIARAQDFQTEIALVEALDFNGATLAKAPAVRTRRSSSPAPSSLCRLTATPRSHCPP